MSAEVDYRKVQAALDASTHEMVRELERRGAVAERDRLRKEVEGLVGFWDNHPSKRLDGPERRLVNEIFDEVLALLDKPGEESR